MAKHSAPGQANWGLWIALAVVGVLLLGGGVFALLRGGDDTTDPSDVAGDDAVSTGEDLGAADRDDDTDDPDDDETGNDAASATTDPADCTPLTVWVAPQVAAAVEQAVDRAGDDCLAYEVVSQADASAQSALQAGDLPDVWLPASEAWPVLMSEAGVELEIGETIASSPVVLAAAPPVIGALEGAGIGPDTSWGELVQQYQELTASGEAPVTLRLGDPRHDPATMALLASTGPRPGGWAEEGGAGRGLLVVLAQSAVQDDPLSAIADQPTGMVPATEQQVASAGADGQQLRGLTVQDGLGVVQMPFVRVGDGGSQGAADALEEELTSAAAAADLQEIWLRPGSDGQAPAVEGMPEVSAEAAEADPGLVAQAAATWAVVAPQSRILTLIDISGSMEAEVGDTTRIDLTREAALAGLTVLPDGTAIGLWYFATALEEGQDHTEVVPLRALGEEVDGGLTQRQQLLSIAADLGLDSLTGDTGLHDSLWAAYQHMQQDATPDSIASVLLLTDGINDDSTGGLSEDEVVDLLTEARESDARPVTVVLIGMGPDVDEAALDRLATAAGGESLVLRDPRELPQIFVEIVARRGS